MPHTAAQAHWTARLAELAADARVQGAVLGIWAGGQQTLASHGMLSTATGVRVTGDSLFQIGSVTKPWTATMIMQLVDEGRLELDTTVSEVLPGVRVGADDLGADITIRHLLTHTAGIDGDIFTDTGRGDDCVERYVSLLGQASQTCPIGQAYSYSNSGYVLLGRIIEVLDERVWDESLRQRLIEPLELTKTVTLPEDAILHRAAVGHRSRPHEADPSPTWMLPRSIGPAGLITASAQDVLTFARMHLVGGVAPGGARVLAEAAAAAMREPQFPVPAVGSSAQAVGLSWRLFEWGGHHVFGHDGNTIGQTAYLRIDPEAGVAVCLLTNSSNPQVLYQRLFSEVMREYAGIEAPAEPEPAEAELASSNGVARHAGRYERTSRSFDVAVRDGRLHTLVTVTGQLAELTGAEPEEVELLPADGSGNHFLCRSDEDEPWAQVSFGALSDGTSYLFSGGRINLRVSLPVPARSRAMVQSLSGLVATNRLSGRRPGVPGSGSGPCSKPASPSSADQVARLNAPR